MKKLFSLLLLLTALSLSAQQASPKMGNRGKNPKRGQAERMEYLKKELNLTDAQVSSIKSINMETREEMKSNRDKYKENKEELKLAQRKLKKAHREKILLVLDEKQKEKLKEIRKQKKESKSSSEGNTSEKNENIDDLLEDN